MWVGWCSDTPPAMTGERSVARRLDPNDPILRAPDFPHGEPRGFKRGCSCERCRAGYNRRRREAVAGTAVPVTRNADLVPGAPVAEHARFLRQHASYDVIGRVAGVSPTVVTRVVNNPGALVKDDSAARILAVTVRQVRGARRFVPFGPAKRHIDTLMKHPGVTLRGVGRAAGVPYTILWQALRRGGERRVSAGIALAIMAVTVDDVLRVASRVPTKRPIQQIKSLQAQDWSLRILLSRLGYADTVKTIPFLRRSEVSVAIAARVDTLYHEIGDRWGESGRSGRMARAEGWWPAIHYDDNGDLIEASLPTAAKANDRVAEARTKLRMVALIARGMSDQAAADIVGGTQKQATRARGMVGLRRTRVPGTNVFPLADGQDALITLIEHAVARMVVEEDLEEYDHEVDYVGRWKRLRAAAGRLRAAGTVASEAA